MIDVSIIIVNYNVRHFLLQCLDSIYRSSFNTARVEVFVVDNASVDGSIGAVSKDYPDVNIIANKSNVGFGKANNQAIKQSKGKHILLLNPDTILQEDTLQYCFNQLSAKPNIGAIGVKMVDGNGSYLKESKRSLPTLWGAFSKMIGIGTLFSNQKWANKYYTSDLVGDQDEEVEVLCGAFMYCNGSMLRELGGFDEKFFMYGEDIDLSKRILDLGYQIYYTAQTRIIHFKGESSKKASFNYLTSFYQAMMIYVSKHYRGGAAVLTQVVLKSAIVLFGIWRAVKEVYKAWLMPIIDGVLIYGFIHLAKHLWSTYYFENPNYYDYANFSINSKLYAVSWVVSIWFWGWYDSQRKLKALIYGVVWGTLAILVIYALLPDNYRSSRALIFLGSIGATIVPLLTKMVLAGIKRLFLKDKSQPNVLIVGAKEEAEIVKRLLESQSYSYKLIGVLHPDHNVNDPYYMNTYNHAAEIIKKYKVDEVIFSHGTLAIEKMLDLMTVPDDTVQYKIAGVGNERLISSNEKNTQGSIIVAYSIYNLSKGVYRRMKRIFDIAISLGMISFIPLLIWAKKLRTVYSQIWHVLIGEKTIVGYSVDALNTELPYVKPGIIKLASSYMPKEFIGNNDIEHAQDTWYAKNYSPFLDIEIILKYIRNYPS